MLTKNGAIYYACFLFLSDGESNLPTLVNKAGENVSNLTLANSYSTAVMNGGNTFTAPNVFMRLGVGSNPVSDNDYNLTDTTNGVDINTLFEVDDFAINNDVQNKRYVYYYKFKYKGSNELTVNEAGLFIGTEYSGNNFFLLNRIVESKTVNTGDYLEVRFSLDFNSLLN